MTVRSRNEAWEKVNKIFPTDYTENTIKTKNAGYPIYDSNLGDDHGYICDLGNRLEVNFADGETVNIWIEEGETTMKNWNDLTTAEKEATAALFTTWLKPYTYEVIVKVMERRDEIINNEFVMNLLRELNTREAMERKDFAYDIRNMFNDFDTFKEYNPHNHPLTHSGSYRDILYDMYIKSI